MRAFGVTTNPGRDPCRRDTPQAALASSVVASIPIVCPVTKPPSASRCRIHVNTAVASPDRSAAACARSSSGRARGRQLADARSCARSASPPPATPSRAPNRGLRSAEQQQPEVPPRRQARPAQDRRVERRAHCSSTNASKPASSRMRFLGLPPIKRMRRAARQVARRNPHRLAAPGDVVYPWPCHRVSVVRGIDRVDP